MRYTKKQAAFTLTEILIVVVIIGAIFALFGPTIARQWRKIQARQAEIKMGTIRSAIMEYQGDTGAYPTKLEDLWERPSGNTPKEKRIAAKWRANYLDGEDDIIDKWNNEFQYSSPPERYRDLYKKYELYSWGPDGEESNDDIHTGE